MASSLVMAHPRINFFVIGFLVLFWAGNGSSGWADQPTPLDGVTTAEVAPEQASQTKGDWAATRDYVLRSGQPSTNWGDALISGNGRQGVMVHGQPLEETIVLNHEKLWVPTQPVKPDVPNMVSAIKQARELAKQEKWGPAASIVFNEFGKRNAEMFPEEALIRPGPRFGLNYVHPALYFKISVPKKGEVKNYSRTLQLDSGEVSVRWTDDRGDWQRDIFVSRPDNVVVTRLRRPSNASLTAELRFAARPGWNEEDIAAPVVEHIEGAENGDDEMYLHTSYRHLHGLPQAEGYQVMSRVIVKGGASHAKSDRILIQDADEVLVLTRTEFLPIASQPSRDRLRADLDELSDSYAELLAAHAKVHGEMFHRVHYRLGGEFGNGRTTEEIIAEAEANGPTPAYLELIFAVGRYSLISSSGELPPTLMGIWGDTWKPMWWGHYTNDSNLNLAISNGSVGNLPEAMESYFSWIETLYPDWERNAQQLYGARGYMGAIAHGWRHGVAIAGWQGWTGATGWLGAYFWQHYLFTGDREFLAERVVPLLENTVLFYQDFLGPMEGRDGKFLIYPSISPENQSPNTPGAPNATSEIAIIRGSVNALIDAYRELGIKKDRIPELQAFLKKVPEYRINEDGAIAEWSYPGVEDNYNHRHNSHLHAVYPGVEINPSTPELYQAARRAIEKRLESGQGNKSAHGFMELGFYGSRLQDPEIVWNMLEHYARSKFIYRSFISSHNPDHRIYNLDSILALPAILTEMCVYSRPGEINLLPGIPATQLPRGEISGVLARKAIVIDRLAWDLPENTIRLELSSKVEQSVAISSRLPIESVHSSAATFDGAQWRLALPANQSVSALIMLEKPN